MESIGIEHAEASAILIVSNTRENVFQKDFVAITPIDENIFSRADELSQIFDLFWSDVDEMKLTKLRLDSKCVERTSWYKFLGRS